MKFFTLVLFVLSLIVEGSVSAQLLSNPPGKCWTPRNSANPKVAIPLYALPTEFHDSIESPSHKFLIHFNAVGSVSDTDITVTPEYVQRARDEADSAYDFEITDLGYPAPEFTRGTHYDLYLAPLHKDIAASEPYGATYILDGGDLSSSPSGNARWRSYVKVDNKFESNAYATKGFDALRITIFHEFFHLIQFADFGYPPTTGVFFQEMSSVWMEWLSTPDVKDYLNYVTKYLSTLDTRFDLSPSNGYGQYIFFAYLTHRFGWGIVRQIWTAYRDKYSDPITCIDYVLRHFCGSSFCMEYARFGSELIATGRRFRGKSLLPDAEILPVDAVKVTVLSPDVTGTFVTEGLSLQYAASGSNGDTCFAVIARDTDRFLQSNCTVRFSSAGEEVIPDRPSAYCDTVVCLTPPGAGVEVFPNPFVIANDADDSVRIVATLNGRPPVSTILDIYSLNGISIHHSVSSTTGFEGSSAVAWNGRDDTGKPVESGEYVYTLLVDGALKVGKIVVVRK